MPQFSVPHRFAKPKSPVPATPLLSSLLQASSAFQKHKMAVADRSTARKLQSFPDPQSVTVQRVIRHRERQDRENSKKHPYTSVVPEIWTWRRNPINRICGQSSRDCRSAVKHWRNHSQHTTRNPPFFCAPFHIVCPGPSQYHAHKYSKKHYVVSIY